MKLSELYHSKMIPFYVTFALYWVWYIPNTQPGYTHKLQISFDINYFKILFGILKICELYDMDLNSDMINHHRTIKKLP